MKTPSPSPDLPQGPLDKTIPNVGTSVKRRTFIQLAAAGGASLCLPSPLLGKEPRPKKAPVFPDVFKGVPITPFDAPAGTWTLAVLPDTQCYMRKSDTEDYSDVYPRQTEWIVANKDKHNILFVAHEGDVTMGNNAVQWEKARKAMEILNQGKVPYALLPGNHDLGPGGRCEDRSTMLNDYFQPSHYANSEAVGFFEEGKMENSWHEFSTPTGKFLLVALEFGPRNAVVEWADKIVATRPDRKVIVDTHAHIYFNGSRYDWTKYGDEQLWNPKSYGMASDGDVNDGEDLWKKFVSRHKNILFVLNGHVLFDGAGYLASKGEGGNIVHQILANYQCGVRPDLGYGGGGYLRLMQFLPDGKTVRVKTYSPWYDKWDESPDQQFEVRLEVQETSKNA